MFALHHGSRLVLLACFHGRPQSIEQDNTDYPGYHSTNDRYSYLSIEQSMDITRGMTGLLYDVAGGQ